MDASEQQWSETQRHWDDFLREVRRARAAVGATYAGAWFRGQTHSWDLSPSLFRNLPDLRRNIACLEETEGLARDKLAKAKRFLARTGRNENDDDEVTLRLRRDVVSAQKKLSRMQLKLPQNGHMRGEGRAFVEFRFRAGCHHQSSWQTLAEMQHYGVPTRLLDWSESFIHALAFALEDHIAILDRQWTKDRHQDSPSQTLQWHHIEVPALDDGTKRVPTLWVLNPYKLADQSKGRNVLWDPTLNPLDDYFRLFVAEATTAEGHSHRFTLPIPILSPWRDERVAAQQGVFTCHGSDTRPLDEQVNSRVLRPVSLCPEAAIHGVRFLREIGGLDRFTMFRDKDSLGKKTKKEFLDTEWAQL
jgi:hypothetical protein